MPAEVLQTFSRLNLIEFGGDDTRLVKLEAAATALAKAYTKDLQQAISVLLALASPASGVDPATLEHVGTAIEQEWSTYHGAYQDGKADMVFRGVAMQALVEAIEVQPALGTAISLLMRNLGPYMEVGKNKPVFDILVATADTAFAAERDVALAQATGDLSHELSSPTRTSKFDRNVLKTRIEAAVGPHNRAGQTVGDTHNPHWPNEGNPWSFDFSDRLTAILGEYLDGAGNRGVEAAAKNHAAVAESLDALANKLVPGKRSSIALLWWRQALYSETADLSYRELAPRDAAVHAVVDLSDLIPPAYERALESFLVEAVLSFSAQTTEFEIQDFSAVSSKASLSLRDAVQGDPPEGLLLTSLALGKGALPVPAPKLTAQNWAVWLLRELAALKALEAAPEIVEESAGE